MDGVRAATDDLAPLSKSGRRRRWEMTSESIRYFLPRPGSSSEKPELGQEIETEGDALVQAFKSGQLFYTLVAWRPVPEINGNEPRIVKQALSRNRTGT